MTVSRDVELEILRLTEAEKLLPGTAASLVGVHHDVVDRVVEQAVIGRPERAPRASKLAPYHGFVCEKLKEYPTICASRLGTMARERGFDGSDRIVQRYVREVRPAKSPRAYLVCERLPGEQAQIDWGHVGRIAVAGGFRALWVFVLYLAYSRMRYAELVLDLTAESLRRSLVRAITFLGGSTRQWLFDNAKTVVLERHGGAARLHPGLLELAGSLRVNPVLARVRTPTDKGGVERSIRDLKTGFFSGRTITDLARGNELLREHIWTVIARRPHPTLPGCTVAEAFEMEKGRLMPLPPELPQTELVLPVAVDKTASVRFGNNRYSTPPEFAGGTLVLRANDERVWLVDGDRQVASHARSWGRMQRIDDPEHRRVLVERRPRAVAMTVRDQLLDAVPGLTVLYERWVQEGRNVNFMTGRVRGLMGDYGREVLHIAVGAMVARGTHDIGALTLLCEQERQRAHRPVPSAMKLGEHVDERIVPTHDLASYDRKKGGAS
ncbi:MAG: IS21 family transposase [Polyangiaceae bacterium]